MRPTWTLVGAAAIAGCAVGVIATLSVRPGPLRPTEPASSTPDVTPLAIAVEPTSRRPAASQRAATALPAEVPATPTTVANASSPAQESKAQEWIADLARARETKDRKLFDQALRRLVGSDDAQAHTALQALIADPDFEFPDSHHAIWCGDSAALQKSTLPGWAAAARKRYERDGRRPGRSWDAPAWLHLLAAHADAADLTWIADQFDTATERQSEVIAALGFAPPALARDAILRELSRPRPADEDRRTAHGRGGGIWRAVEILSGRSSADAFAVLDVIVKSDAQTAHDANEVRRKWVQMAPKDRLADVRSQIRSMAAGGLSVRELMPPIQALSDRSEDISEFDALIARAGQELRRLVDEKEQADGTGPYYAIEYHKVAQTSENLAALEYAIQRLGQDRTRGCQKILAEARSRSDWK